MAGNLCRNTDDPHSDPNLIGDKCYDMVLRDHPHVGHGISAILYPENTGGFVKVLGHAGNYRISIDVLDNARFTALPMIDLLIESDGRFLRYHAGSSGPNLYKEADSRSQVTDFIAGERYEIRVLRAFDRQWAKVQVTKKERHIHTQPVCHK